MTNSILIVECPNGGIELMKEGNIIIVEKDEMDDFVNDLNDIFADIDSRK